MRFEERLAELGLLECPLGRWEVREATHGRSVLDSIVYVKG